jgi:serine/threonine-protein kinase
MATDTRLAWAGTYGPEDVHLEKVRVEAASWHGRPVLFEVQGLPSQKMVIQTQPNQTSPVLARGLVALVAALIVWRNLRLGRFDRRGAGVVGGSVLVLAFGGWLMGHEPVGDPSYSGAEASIVLAGFTCLAYMAIEPYVRRRWPDSFISWTRLCSGKIRNPLVASHVLAGIVGGEAFLGLYAAISALSSSVPLVNAWGLAGISDEFSYWMRAAVGGLNTGLGLLLLVVALRLVIRKIWIADWLAAFLIALSRMGSFGSGLWRNVAVVIFFTPVTRAWVWLLRRYGFLAMLVVFLTALPITGTPFLLTGWMAGQAVTLHLIPVAVAVWALWVIVSAQRRPAADTAG